jgi:DNA polymerase-3 subunit epsilon
MFRLERPLAVIDVESTGLDPKSARIVRITVLKVWPDGKQELKSVLINPGEPVSPGATAVHGITDDDIQDARPFRSYAKALSAYLEGCDFAGFGIERFDLPLLVAEFARAGVPLSLQGRAVVDAMAVFHRLEPRDLKAAYRRFTGRDLPDVREADTGARAAFEVLEGQLEQHPELPQDVAGLSSWLRGAEGDAIDPEGKFVWSPEGEVLVNFGRFRGHRLAAIRELQGDYLQWVAGNPEFAPEVRKIAAGALEGVFPRKEE